MSEELYGPVEVYAVEFPTDRVPDGVKVAVVDALASGAVTLLDLAVIRRSADGAIDVIDAEDLGAEIDITEIEIARPGLAGQEDIDDIAAGLAPGTSAVVLVIEHTWSRGLVRAMSAEGGVVLTAERIPAAVVNELVGFADAAANH